MAFKAYKHIRRYMPLVTGIGTDIIEIKRIAQAMARHKAFSKKIFTKAEREYCLSMANPAQHFAGRFAAKEAVAKALGAGLSWLDVEILPDISGKPSVNILNRASKLFPGRKVLVSISHSRIYAVACAVVTLDCKNNIHVI